jgi:hypothetical protein
VLFPDCVLRWNCTMVWYCTTQFNPIFKYHSQLWNPDKTLYICSKASHNTKSSQELWNWKSNRNLGTRNGVIHRGTYLSKTYINQYIGTIIYIQNRQKFSGRKVKTKQKTCYIIDFWAWLKYNIAEKLL